MTSNMRKSFSCSFCSNRYGRAEHLKRHEALHSGVTPYTCGVCNKSFTRKDALARHREVHDGGPSLLETKSRACLACAKSKSKCTGTRPCGRCSKRNITCSFPSRQTEGEMLQQGEAILDQHIDMDSSVSVPVGSIMPHVEVYGGGSPRSTRDAPDLQTNSHINREPTTGSLDGQIPMAGVVSEAAVASTSFQDIGSFDPSYWSPNMVSSINWLPIDLPTLPFDDNFVPLAMFEGYAPTHNDHNISGYDIGDQSGALFEEALESPVTQISGEGSRSVTSQRTGDYYIDSDAARLPRIKRRKIINQPNSSSILAHRTFDFDLSFVALDQASHCKTITVAMYEALCSTFEATCITCTPPVTPFISTKFLSKSTFEDLLNSFFLHVQQSLSFIHPTTIERKMKSNNRETQALFIAMAALGSRFLDSPHSALCASSMLEFGRRLMMHIRTVDSASQGTELAQAQLLLVIGAKMDLHNSNNSGWVERSMHDLRAFCLRCARYQRGNHLSASLVTDQDWDRAIGEEEKLRTAYCVWQIDLLEYAQGDDERPHLPLSTMAGLPLPQNHLWLATDVQTFKTGVETDHRLTLFEALRCLYMEKRLPESLNDLDHVVILYAVIHRTWEVEHDVSQPFSNMEPSAVREQDYYTYQTTQWPPAVPHFARWRNSACDCFDILHWQANAAIGNAKGLEPPKVLHLHLARLLILVPLVSILRLSRRKGCDTTTGAAFGVSGTDDAQRIVHRWATSDQYKARLSAIHAGVIFWHIRRYSINAFYEPFAVLAATITLWAISFFKKQPDTEDEDDLPALENRCEIILIDRPTDDELVQQFVRSGDKMKVHMSAANNLWDSDAPAKILREGKKLLLSLGAWSADTGNAIDILEGLPKHK